MPELPEAETIARDLRPHVRGRRIEAVQVSRPDVLAPGLSPDALAAGLTGRRIRDVGRRGKNLVLDLERGHRLVVNLGMTGRLMAAPGPAAAELRHVAVRFELDGGRALLYDDVRRFGRIELLAPRAWAARDAALGAEPLSPALTAEALHDLVRASRSPIRNWLLDQRRLAGVGNIYASEALGDAAIHPARPAASLSAEDASRLLAALRAVLQAAIQARGTTLNDYRDGNGKSGGFGPRLRYYGREGEACPRCGEAIRRLVLTNRSAFFCPRCQRLSRPRSWPAVSPALPARS